ncbi:MAG: 50S ribosomal protein L24e [Candidatus Methanomethylicota archaeon]|uniref:Large ribosomal subunit protein eL24 n=1 Tax=Thermoproteota archaeon TaxID=2056631 RepID=A0A497EV37_9CREN|nr:MAG: 50S ribosomal protein L24e [Candidatus Verstraetearchaeota archaeon]
MSLRVKKCSFCGSEIPKGCGIMYVKTDGTILYFCSSKCRKSMIILKRKPHKVKWVIKSIKGKSK